MADRIDAPADAGETPTERSMRARIAAYSRWAREDPRAGTEPARKAFADKFTKEVDPDNQLPEQERQRRAESKRKAYYTRLARKSAQARRRRTRKAP
jgi:hypothetical protein